MIHKSKNRSKPKGKVTVNQAMHKQRVRNIHYVLNRALGKFFIIGDRNRLPMSFHLSDMHLQLKGTELRQAKEQMIEFFFQKEQTWNICFYHYFRYDEQFIEVTPVLCTLENTTLGITCDYVNSLAKATRELIIASGEHDEEAYETYAYQINFGGDNLNFDKMDPQFIEGFLKITKDLSTSDKTQEVIVNGFTIVDQISNEKFSLTDTRSAVSDFMSIDAI